MQRIRNFLVFGKEHIQLSNANLEITRGVFVRNIPPQGAKFPSLLNERVEEAQSEKKFLPLLWSLARIKELVVKCVVSSYRRGKSYYLRARKR